MKGLEQAVEKALAEDREASLRDVFAGVALGGFLARGTPTCVAVAEAWHTADLMLEARKKGR